MVGQSLTFIALLLCIFLAQSVVSKPSSKAEDTDSESEDSSDEVDESGDEEDPEEPLYPSLSCLLFDDIGCNSECSVMGDAFGHKATGVCADDICECSVTTLDTSLDTLWNEKFNSKAILQQIKKDKQLSEEIREILQDPFKTAQESKEELKSVLSKDQYNKLKLKDNDNAAAKMKKNGKLDLTAIKKHVSKKLPSTLKSSDRKTLSALKYKSILLKALKNAKNESDEQDDDTFDQLVLDVRRTKNTTLGDILTEYLKKNKFQEPAKDKNQSSVADAIADYVVDELVKMIDDKKPAKTGKTPVKKSSATKKDVEKSNNKKSTADDVDDDDRFKLKNFDKCLLKRSSEINQTWSKNGYKVSYQRSYGGDINLDWRKGVDKVSIQKSAGSDVNQNWDFGKVRINISKSAGGDINENWNFGTAKYQYSRSAGGSVYSNWSSGKTDKKILKKYQGFIDAWCRDNDFLITKAYCVIYNTRT